MNNLYNVFNVQSEHEFSKFFDKLNLSTNDLIAISEIAENATLTLANKREQILEVLAGSSDGNYELCLEQFNKVQNQRVLKENNIPSLNLNQVMELNQLVENVANKLNIPNCIKGLYSLIKNKTNDKIAKTFIGMVQQSQVNNSELKFNTELQVNGQNLAMVIYQIKEPIEMFINSLKNPQKDNKSEQNSKSIQETKLNESFNQYEEIVRELDKIVDGTTDINILSNIAQRINVLLTKAGNMNEANNIAKLKSTIDSKINELSNNSKIDECVAQDVVSTVCGEDTFNGLLNSLKPTMISITVNKETGDIESDPCNNEECYTEPCNSAYPCPTQNMEISPTAIDTPILQKPNSAIVTSAITALSSHTNDIKSDSRENNIENLETINTLIRQISDYFNTLLSENAEYKVGQKVMYRKNGTIYVIRRIKDGFYDLKDGYSNQTYPVSKETLDTNFKLLNETINSEKLFKNDDAIASLQNEIINLKQKLNNRTSNKEEIMMRLSISQSRLRKLHNKNEQLMNEDTVFDHSWYEVEGQKYPKRTKEGVQIKETCSAGATCAGSVSGFAKPLGEKPKKRKKKSSIDVDMFKESINNDIDCALNINGKILAYRLYEGKGYLYIDNGIVKANDKNTILEAIDDFYNDCLELPIYENVSPIMIDMLLEDDLNTNTVITPAEKQKQEQELDNSIQSNPQMKVSVVDDKDTNTITDNQELVGIDDSDITDKKYVTRDPNTGKIKVVNSTQIKISDNGVK